MDVRRGAQLEAIESLYRERYPDFVRVAAMIAGGSEAGKDAVHDAFVGIVSSRTRYRGEGTLEAWVWRAVVNSARRQRRRGDVSGRILEEHAGNGRERLDDDLRLAIRLLPERQRLVLFLRYFADLDYRAIAQTLEISAGTVAATLHAAHRSLRRSVEEAVHE